MGLGEIDLLAPALIGGLLLISWALRKPAKQHWRARNGQQNRSRFTVVQNPDAPAKYDSGQQLNVVMSASFQKRRVLSAKEARVLAEAERAIEALKRPWRVMAQVSLGEILWSPDRDAYGAINAKRVDLLIVSERHEPIAAVEYQGTGHYLSDAAGRDAVKKEALRKAGIAYIEIAAGHHNPADLQREIARLAA